MKHATTAHTYAITIKHFLQCNCMECEAMVDYGSKMARYVRGYTPPRYPVPAHRYKAVFNSYSVELYTGSTRQWYPTFPEKFQGPYYDVELVMLWTDYPKDIFT